VMTRSPRLIYHSPLTHLLRQMRRPTNHFESLGPSCQPVSERRGLHVPPLYELAFVVASDLCLLDRKMYLFELSLHGGQTGFAPLRMALSTVKRFF
jgi:hypothetical protein